MMLSCPDAMETGEFDEGHDICGNEVEANDDPLVFEHYDEIVDFSDNSEYENFVNAKV